MKEIPLPTVTRVQEGRSSNVEPPIDDAWDEAAKLAWHAAIVAHDTGLRIKLHDEALIVNDQPQPGYYHIAVYGSGVSSASSFTYRDAWTYLSGITVGAQMAKEAR